VAKENASKSILGKLWRIKWWLLSIFTILFLLFALFFPLNNYYVELPGGAFDTKEVLTVDKKADDSKGSYNFVAVAQTKATLALMLYAQLNDFAKLQTAEEATGNYSDEDFMRINQFYMETSQNQAIYQGLTLAGKEASLEYMGVYVLQVADDSSFKGVLNIEDTVTAVNGKSFDNSTDLIKYVQGLKLGSKVKGAIFNMIGPFFDGGRVLDLFSGSGSLAIEAISRGMSSAVLVEKDRRAQAVIQENIKMTKSEKQFQLLKMDAARALTQLTGQFDLVLLDPPYAKEQIVANITQLEEQGLLAEEVMLVCETDKAVDLPEEISNFGIWKQKTYGISKVTVYVR